MDSEATKFLSSSGSVSNARIDRCEKKAGGEMTSHNLGHKYLSLLWGKSSHLDVKPSDLESPAARKYVC